MFTHLLATWQRKRNRRAAIRHLRSMPGYLLADVGIPPDRVAEVVDGLLAQRDRDEARDNAIVRRPAASQARPGFAAHRT